MRYFLLAALTAFAVLLLSTARELARLQAAHDAFTRDFSGALARRDREFRELADRCGTLYETKPAFGPTPVPELVGAESARWGAPAPSEPQGAAPPGSF